MKKSLRNRIINIVRESNKNVEKNIEKVVEEFNKENEKKKSGVKYHEFKNKDGSKGKINIDEYIYSTIGMLKNYIHDYLYTKKLLKDFEKEHEVSE